MFRCYGLIMDVYGVSKIYGFWLVRVRSDENGVASALNLHTGVLLGM